MDTTKYRDTECWYCGDDVHPKRAELLKADNQPMRCMSCGEEAAILARKSWCIAPMHKSNYMLFTQKADLVGINNKGGLVK
jgi:hypothetical protein